MHVIVLIHFKEVSVFRFFRKIQNPKEGKKTSRFFGSLPVQWSSHHCSSLAFVGCSFQWQAHWKNCSLCQLSEMVHIISWNEMKWNPLTWNVLFGGFLTFWWQTNRGKQDKKPWSLKIRDLYSPVQIRIQIITHQRLYMTVKLTGTGRNIKFTSK